MSDIYWDSFYKSGEIEQYLKYRGSLTAEGNDNAVTENREDSKGKSNYN